MKIAFRALLALAAGLSFSAPLAAQESAGGRLELHTRTMLIGQEQATGVFADWPAIQWLELSGYDLGVPGLSAHTSVWGLGALGGGGDVVTGDAVAGDVDLLYAQYVDPEGHYAARVGRQLVLTAPGGGFGNQIDGLWLRGALRGFEAEAYGGHVIAPRFSNLSQYDWLAGGRAGYRKWGAFSAGLSYLHARNDGRLSRENLGIDASVGILDGLDASGFLAYDLINPGLAESALLARWRPTNRITAGLQLRQASPGRLIDQSSIFSVFSLADFAEFGALIDWVWTEQWSLGADYARVFFPDESGAGLGEQANRFAVRVTGFPRRDVWVRVRAERLPSPDNGYTALRIAGRWLPRAPYSVNVDLLGYFYDDAPLTRGDAGSQSLMARLFAEYRIRKGVMIGVGGDIAQTVLTDFEARALLRLTWATDIMLGGGR